MSAAVTFGAGESAISVTGAQLREAGIVFPDIIIEGFSVRVFDPAAGSLISPAIYGPAAIWLTPFTTAAIPLDQRHYAPLNIQTRLGAGNVISVLTPAMAFLDNINVSAWGRFIPLPTPTTPDAVPGLLDAITDLLT